MTRITALIITLLLSFFTTIWAQDTPRIDSVYTWKKLNRSLSFAQLTYGGDLLMLSGATRTRNGQSADLPATFMPRATIGGMHFWGHADFYVTFPLFVSFSESQAGIRKYRLRESVETGMKVYPWALRPGKVRPYVGISFQPFTFGYEEVGNANEYTHGAASYERFVTPAMVGATYTTRKFLFTVGARFNWKNRFDAYYQPDATEQIRVLPVNFTLGLLRYIDTDKGLGSPKSVEQQNLKHYLLEKHGKMSTWYKGIGPSTALQMSKSSFFEKKYPFLADNMLNSFLLPDVTLGYHFAKPDINVGFAGRAMGFRAGAFEDQFRLGRVALSVEAYKFLFDYHGFVPFVGPMVSVDRLWMRHNGQTIAAATKPSLGIVFGWDIRVTKTGTGLLRTNLRYTPGLHLDVQGEKVMYNHLEFNFIQLVKFIGRDKVYQQYRKR
jgi:hypothetical protein